MLSSHTPSIGPTNLEIAEIFLSVRDGLQAVEREVIRCFQSDASVLTEISEYLLKQGGKRIRPTMALVSARLFGMDTPSPELIDLAAGIELIHMATLLHDDIIDESPTRRHQKSAYLAYGLPASLLAGDFLLVRAFGMCARLDRYVVNQTERACVELVEGEVLEGILDGTSDLELRHYRRIIEKKTASLFGLACELGAHQAGQQGIERESLRRFGIEAGVVFQMVDDILDITADEDLLGKPSGTDLRQKTPSLINILWLASGDAHAREFFSLEKPTGEESRSARSYLLETRTVITEAQKIARECAEKAEESLLSVRDRVVDKRALDQLLSLVDYTLNRCL